MRKQWIIKDWAGNTCFKGRLFSSFEDAEEYLCLFFESYKLDYEEERQEYYIQVKEQLYD